MADVNSNFVTLAQSIESAPGTAGTTWTQLEYNPGALRVESNVATVTRNPVSKNRQRRAGAPVSRDAGLGYDTDLTMHALEAIIEAFFFAKGEGPGLTDGEPFRPTAVTSTGYTVASGGALAQYTLVYARGFPDAENNGLKVVGASSTATEIKTSGLTADASVSDTENATVEICGVQGTSGDITMTAGGDLASTTLDFTTLGLTDGQWIKIGGDAAATQFATAAYNGWARVRGTVTANLIPLDRHSFAEGADAGTGKTIHIYFGRFFRQRDVDNADAIERTFTHEYSLPDMDGAATDRYGYVTGCYANELAMQFPLQSIATMSVGYMALTADPPVVAGSRLSGASSMRQPRKTSAIVTSNDYGRLALAEYDETGITTSLKNMTVTMRNNCSREYIQGTFDPAKVNVGQFEVDVELDLWFDSVAVAEAVADNTTCSLNVAMQCDDGGFYLDIPACKLGGGAPAFPAGETVQISATAAAEQDPALGYTIGISTFPYLPPLT